jgi:hypothetical protein
LETVLIAVVTALVTTVATGWLVAPRLDARKHRILELHKARDQFLASMLQVLSAAARLQNFPAPDPNEPAWTEVMRERVAAERARWVEQLDEATKWMVDNIETYALTWPMDFLRSLIGNYVSHARAVMISERQDGRKAELLEELTTPVWEVFGSRGWQRSPRRLMRAEQRLTAVIEEISAEVDRQNSAPAAAA